MTDRIVVVSNRVAPIDEGRAAAGGLAVAVLAALRRSGGIWFGWSGKVVDAPGEAVQLTRSGQLARATVDLGERDYEEYYNGFANATLWPLFHYRVDLVNFDRGNYAGYRRVNAEFARKLAPLIEPDDVIWAHDYHLIPLAEELRRLGLTNRMGFFLHTPMPPRELLATLPVHDELMRGLSSFDLVGFQTEIDRGHFCRYLIVEADARVRETGGGATVRAFQRTFRVESHPIGIDTAHVERSAANTAGIREVERLKVSLAGRRLIVGVDRLDYSKGLPQRFDAFAHLLRTCPEHHNRVSLMQVAPPTRGGIAEYSETRRTLETLAGHVNGEMADVDWVPIRYLNKSFSRRTLFGFLRLARVGLVTPLRDGMNLVAMEYLASQPPDDPGVLVLSRFAGAARYLPDSLIVNPYDVEGVAGAIQTALTMPLEERRERWERSMQVLRSNGVEAWYERFVASLAEA